MERSTIERLKQMFGNNFIGPDELQPLFGKLNQVDSPTIPDLNCPIDDLAQYTDDCLLVMGLPSVGGKPLSIRTLREAFGVDPDVSEPCFYNQDWYMHEDFIDLTLESRWYLVRKQVVESSRAVMPDQLMANHYMFPSAVLCAYAFFAYWFHYGEPLWYHDFVWCSDTDHNGDRIYVGKYHDVDGVNKNGFSVHRHLALRSCYAAVTCQGL